MEKNKGNGEGRGMGDSSSGFAELIGKLYYTRGKAIFSPNNYFRFYPPTKGIILSGIGDDNSYV
jgi:hypothetical protein